jgi:pimeloyl-ACP methyl ester carboxylesterase
VALIGHSYAGLVVREAALRAPEKVREVVLVEGWIGPGGASFTDPTTAADNPMRSAVRAILAGPGPVPFADMANRLGISTQRIEGGHDLMITSPRSLAEALLSERGRSTNAH